MSPDQLSMAEGYLHKVLVNGVTPFRYRSTVRSLLGMPDNEVNTSPTASLPPIEFLYAIPRSTSAGLPDLMNQEDRESDHEAWADWDDLPIAESAQQSDRPLPLLHEPNIQTNLPTSQGKQLPLSSEGELPDLRTDEAIASSTMPSISPEEAVREIRSAMPLENLPTAITIPGMTDHRSPVLESGLTIPGFPQPTNAKDGQPQSAEPMDSSQDSLQHSISELPARKVVPAIPDASPGNPPSVAGDSSIKGVASEPATASFRKQASTGINTRSAQGLATQATPLPIAATLMPMASASNIPYSPAATPPAAKVTEELTKLRRVVADLTAQVAAQQEFRRPAAPVVLPSPVQIVERPVPPPKAPQAFWERSYVSRLYRRSHR